MKYKEIQHDDVYYSNRMIPIGARPQIDPNLTNPIKPIATAPTIPTESPSSGWTMEDVSKLTLVNSYDVPLSNPTTFTFMDSGNKMLVYDAEDSSVNQYSLQSPYSITGASFDSKFVVISNVTEMFVDDSGTRLFLLRETSSIGSIYIYTMSSQFYVGSLVFCDRISIGEGYYKSMTISSNGYHLYIGSDKGFVRHIYMHFPLQLGWIDVVEDVKVSGATSVGGIVINPPGTRMYVIDGNTNLLKQYSLATPYHIAGHSYDILSFDLSGIGATSIFIEGPDYADVFGCVDGTLYKYQILLNWKWTDADNWTSTGLSYDASSISTQFSPAMFYDPVGNRNKLYLKDNQRVFEFDFPDPNDISSLSLVQSKLFVGSDSSLPEGIHVSPDGRYLFLPSYLAYVSGYVRRWRLDTPWDISSATNDRTKVMDYYNQRPEGISFSPDGSRMFLQTVNSTVDFTSREYTLSIPWDPETATEVYSKAGTITRGPIAWNQSTGKQWYSGVYSQSTVTIQSIPDNEPYTNFTSFGGNNTITYGDIRNFVTYIGGVFPSVGGTYAFVYSYHNRIIVQLNTDVVSF